MANTLRAEQDALRALRPKGRYPVGPPLPPSWAALLPAGVSGSGAARPDSPLEPRLGAHASMQTDEGSAEAATQASREPEAAGAPISGPDEPLQDGVARTGEASGPSGLAEAADVDAGAAPLLPPNCYVARSLGVLQSAVGGQGVSQSCEANTSGVDASSAAARLEPASAGKASKRAGAGVGHIWRPRGAPHPRCMVRVSLQVIGPGRAQQGAALHALTPEQARNVRVRIVQRKLQRGGGAATWQAVEGPPGVPERSADVGNGEVVGFITSEAPRGLPPWRGATAICRADALWEQLKCNSLVKAGRRKHLGMAMVAFANPASPATLQLAEAHVEFDQG